MDKGIKLYPHNLEGYKKVKEAYISGEKVVGIVHATGTGKSYISLQLCLDNPDKKTIFVVPSNAIIEHIIETIGECGLSLEHDFPNLQFATYQSLTTKSDEELASMNIDMLVLDEFHHIGAPVWGEQVNKIVDSHPDMKVFGMTAYTVRDRGTSYERDMALPGGNELFSDKIVSTYDIYDAMCDGVLPIPNYKSAYLNLINEIYDIESEILDSKIGNELKKDYLNKLKSCKQQIDKAPKAKDLIKENLNSKDKCIYFCPVNDSIIVNGDEILGTNDISSIRTRIGVLALEVSDKIIFYETTSDLGEYGKMNRDHFYNDTSFFKNEDVSNILRVMFAKNQYNEGVHAPGVTKIFMARQTNSDIVFFEQLGRALSVRGNIIELTKEYESKNIEELKYISNNQCIDISKCNSKEEIIERLLAPTIVDLVGNIEFIRELRDNLKERIKERQEKGIPTKITRKLVDVAFDISVENEEIFQVLQDLRDKTHGNLTVEQAIEEIYTLYEKTGKMPNRQCEERLSNGTQIGGWIYYNKDEIIKLAQQGNEKAQKIVNELKLDKIVLTIEQAIDEIYALYEKTGIMPNTKFKERFSNGTIIGKWLSTKMNQEKIIIVANQGNKKAQIIVEKLKLNQEKIVLTIEQAVGEIYDIYLKTGQMPNTNSSERFSNGTTIGTWLNTRKNKEKIIKLGNQGNEKARTIVEKLKLNQKKIVIEQAVEEIYDIYLKTGKMPNTASKERFSNGTTIGTWLNKRKNKEKIIELGNQGNEKARTIVEKLKLNQEKIVIEQALEEIYDIYLKTGKMPNTQCKEIFSNGTTIGTWLSKKDNQEKLIRLANQCNEKSRTIVEKLKLNQEKIVLTIEQAVDEIYDIYLKTGIMPNTASEERFSNGTVIGFWLSLKNNQEKIIELVNQYNEKARTIVEKLKLNQKKIVIEQAVEEIYDIYLKTGKMPNTASKERFSNGTVIGSWLGQKNNQEKIIELVNQCNEKAKIIVEELKINQEKIVLTIEQMVEEIYAIYEREKEMPNTNSSEKFSNGTVIGKWLQKKKNQEKIIELANQCNEKAQTIVSELKWNFTDETAVDEIYALYKKTGIMPNTQCEERLSIGTKIGNWLRNKKNQEKIIELAQQGNIKAQMLCESLSKKKDKDIYIELCNEYNIDYNKNKKYIDNITYTLLKAIIEFFIDNNVPYIDSNGMLVSDIFMSSKDFENKYGISIIQLISNQKTI